MKTRRWNHESGRVFSGPAVPAVCAGVSPATNAGARGPSGRRDACSTTSRFIQKSVGRSVQRVNRVRCAPSLFALHALLLGAPSGALAQEARLVNAQVQTRAITSSLEMDLRSLVHGQVEPAWIGYSVPAIEGNHHICC